MTGCVKVVSWDVIVHLLYVDYCNSCSWSWASFLSATFGAGKWNHQELNSHANPNAALGSRSWPLGQVNWQRGKPLTHQWKASWQVYSCCCLSHLLIGKYRNRAAHWPFYPESQVNWACGKGVSRALLPVIIWNTWHLSVAVVLKRDWNENLNYL